MELHVHVHSDYPNIEKKLDKIIENQGVLMARVDDLNAELVEINNTTDEIAADIADLQVQAANGVNASDAAAFASKLGELKTKLQAVASTHTPGSVEPPVDPPLEGRRR